MEPVFAKSSSHGHAAQTQQGPRDTWNAWEEGRWRKGGEFLPYSGARAAVAGRNPSTHTSAIIPILEPGEQARKAWLAALRACGRSETLMTWGTCSV